MNTTEQNGYKVADEVKSVIGIQPVYDLKDVTIELGQALLSDYAKGVVDFLKWELNPTLQPRVEELGEWFCDFCHDLVAMRIAYVNGKRTPLKVTDTGIIVPAFVNFLISQIGNVTADEYGLYLRPALIEYRLTNEKRQVEKKDDKGKAVHVVEDYKLDEREFGEKLRKMGHAVRTLFDQANLTYAQGLPKTREGELKVMAMEVLQGQVFAENNHATPEMGLAAAVLGINYNQTLVMPRVSYGTLEDMRHSIAQVVVYERRN